MFPGIADRMQKELTALAPSSVKASYYCHVVVYELITTTRRSRLLLLRSVNIQSGSEVPSWRPSAPSRIYGSPSKSMTSPVPASFIAVRIVHLILFMRFLLACRMLLSICGRILAANSSVSSHVRRLQIICSIMCSFPSTSKEYYLSTSLYRTR